MNSGLVIVLLAASFVAAPADAAAEVGGDPVEGQVAAEAQRAQALLDGHRGGRVREGEGETWQQSAAEGLRVGAPAMAGALTAGTAAVVGTMSVCGVTAAVMMGSGRIPHLSGAVLGAGFWTIVVAGTFPIVGAVAGAAMTAATVQYLRGGNLGEVIVDGLGAAAGAGLGALLGAGMGAVLGGAVGLVAISTLYGSGGKFFPVVSGVLAAGSPVLIGGGLTVLGATGGATVGGAVVGAARGAMRSGGQDAE